MEESHGVIKLKAQSVRLKALCVKFGMVIMLKFEIEFGNDNLKM
jgi:hypothetical protein